MSTTAAEQRNAINELKIELNTVEEVKGEAEHQFIACEAPIAEYKNTQKNLEPFFKML